MDFEPYMNQQINAATQLYGVMGSPVSHSQSPLVHNRAFAHQGINAVYLAFEPPDAKSCINAIRSLNIKGASITIPFKAGVMDYLDWIDPEAGDMGAVNTIVNDRGSLLGYNTDSKAAVDPLKPFGIAGKTVCIVGAGGAARAVAFGIWKNKGRLVIVNRTAQTGMDLAGQYQGRFCPLQDISQIQADILINTTSIGMAPAVDQAPVPLSWLRPEMVVMDVVYTPPDTRLIQAARQRGCHVVDGLAMFIAQAAAQFKLWTGIEPDQHQMRTALLTK